MDLPFPVYQNPSGCSPRPLSSSSPFPSAYPGTCSFGQALDWSRERTARCSMRVTRFAHPLRSSLLLAQLLAFANSHENTLLPHRTSLSSACPLRLHNAGNHRVHHQQLLGRAQKLNTTRLLAVPRPRPPRTFNAAEMVTMTNEGEVFECEFFESVLRCACPAVLRCEQVPRCFRGPSIATSPAGSPYMAACDFTSISDPDASSSTLSCLQEQHGRLHCTSNASREARGAPGSGCAAARRAVQGRCFRPG